MSYGLDIIFDWPSPNGQASWQQETTFCSEMTGGGMIVAGLGIHFIGQAICQSTGDRTGCGGEFVGKWIAIAGAIACIPAVVVIAGRILRKYCVGEQQVAENQALLEV